MEVDDVNVITVLGAGRMGHGIAEVAALAGFEVRLRDIETAFVEEGYEQIEWSLDKLAQGEVINQITVEEDTAHYARLALDRMLEMS